MKRFATSVAVAASLLLVVAIPVLWVRSLRIADRYLGTTDGLRYIDLASVDGGVELRVAPRYPYRERFAWHTSTGYRRPRGPWYALGFACRRDTIRFLALDNGPPRIPPAPYWMVRVPYWFPLVVFAAYPAARARSTRRAWTQRHRRAHGLCLNCGYDVRASTERCPECGIGLHRDVTSRSAAAGPS